MTQTYEGSEPTRTAVVATVTLDSSSEMSCEVLDDQIQFMFGTVATGLYLYLDWPALERLAAVAHAAIRQARTTPPGQPVRFMVSVDARSREEHTPNYPHDHAGELLVSDVVHETGRHHLL